jgi:hypothetical protein
MSMMSVANFAAFGKKVAKFATFGNDASRVLDVLTKRE